jgi:hypothetical protein
VAVSTPVTGELRLAVDEILVRENPADASRASHVAWSDAAAVVSAALGR